MDRLALIILAIAYVILVNLFYWYLVDSVSGGQYAYSLIILIITWLAIAFYVTSKKE